MTEMAERVQQPAWISFQILEQQWWQGILQGKWGIICRWTKVVVHTAQRIGETQEKWGTEVQENSLPDAIGRYTHQGS